jgi:hypothetical protein
VLGRGDNQQLEARSGVRLPVSRRVLLATMTGASAAVVGTSMAGAQGRDGPAPPRSMSSTVLAHDAGAPFQGTGDFDCDGAADEVQINEAIARLARLGGGTVELSRGTFSIDGPIVMQSCVSLVGQGSGGPWAGGATTIRRTGAFAMLTIRGEGPGGGPTHVHGVRVRDVELDGADHRAAGILTHYADTIVIERIVFRAIQGSAVEGVEWWDSTVNDCRFDFCGSRDGSNAPAVALHQSLPEAPSSSSTNNIHFVNCTWESFADGAIGLFGTGGDGRLNVCHFVNCKLESRTLRGVAVRAEYCVDVSFRNLHIAVGEFEHQTEPQDAFTIANSYNVVVEGYWANAIATDTQSVRTFLSLKGDNRNVFLHQLMFDAAATNKPSVAAIELAETNERVDLGYHSFGFDAGESVLRAGDTSKKYRSSGSATVAGGRTSVVVTHQLHRAPDLADIAVTPNNGLGSASRFWVDDPTDAGFRINVDVDPSGDGARFSWQAEAS